MKDRLNATAIGLGGWCLAGKGRPSTHDFYVGSFCPFSKRRSLGPEKKEATLKQTHAWAKL
jgi:hypothetical protein